MECRHCLEEIKDGAAVCPHCRRKQAKFKIWKWAAIGAVTLVVGFMFIGCSVEQGRVSKLRRAAACNGTLTYDQLEAAAEKSAADTGEGILTASDTVAELACPSIN